MIETEKLGLFKPDIDSEVEETINKLAQNFQIIDDNYDEIVVNYKQRLIPGNTYKVAKKLWNRSVDIDGFAGWVNVREGVFAPDWEHQKRYTVGNIISPKENNGYYYECIASGTSGIVEPLFSTVDGEITYDIAGHSIWTPSYNYKINDIVIKSDGDKNFYYKCIIAGTSGAIEPSWNNIEGSTVIDGSVQWLVYKTIRWMKKGISCNFIPFGYIKGSRKFVGNLGDGVNNTFTVNHNLGTKDVVVNVISNLSFSLITDVHIEINDENNIDVTFQSTPAINQYRIVIIG